MNTRLASVLCIALAAAPACKKSEKSGPAVARVGDEVITADEVRQRLNETSPFLRARYSTIERKKEFLENMVRNELLAQEAIRQGYDKSPAVREQMKRAMIQELIKKQLDAKLSGSDIPDEELKKFYEAHIDEFVKPERARVLHIFLPAADAKQRAGTRVTIYEQELEKIQVEPMGQPPGQPAQSGINAHPPAQALPPLAPPPAQKAPPTAA